MYARRFSKYPISSSTEAEFLTHSKAPLSSRFADFRCGRRPFHSHDVGWSHGVLKRSQPLSLAASRRSGGAAHKLDKLRKRGFSITPLPIHTHELAPPALPA